MRAAEPDPASPTGWRVNVWVKQGILLGFRFGDIVDMGIGKGRWPFFDKDTLPLKPLDAASGVRIVPGGSSVRDGAYLGSGVICMPPMYINVGAYVGDGTLVDSHALVGSCAQIGQRVHLSAAAQIGGVIEPVGAMPVIIEDDVLSAATAASTKARSSSGAPCWRRARSSPARRRCTTCRTSRIITPEPGQPLVDPRRRRRRAGRARGDRRRRPRVGPVAGDAGHREVSRREDRRAHRARAMDPVATPRRARRAALVDIDSTTGREGEARRVARRRFLRERGYSVTEQPVADGRFNVFARLDAAAAGRVLHALRLRARRSSRAARSDGLVFGRGCVRREGHPRRAGGRGRAAARGGRDSASALLFVVGEERGSDGARVANEQAPAGVRYLVNGEPTDNRLGAATRGVLRVRLRATGRAAHSSFPELGESAIDKLLDALMVMRGVALPEDPLLGPDALHRRAHRGRRRAERRLAARVGRAAVPHRRRRRAGARGAATCVEGLVARRARARHSRRAHAHAARLRDGGLSLHDRRAAADPVGHAAARGPRLDPRGAHRRGARGDRRAAAGRRPVRGLYAASCSTEVRCSEWELRP